MFSLLHGQPDDPSSRDNQSQENPQEQVPQDEIQQAQLETSQELPSFESQDRPSLEERLRALVPSGARVSGVNIALATALLVALIFGFHERNLVAKHSLPQGTASGQRAQNTASLAQPAQQQQSAEQTGPAQVQSQMAAQMAEMKDTRSQIEALNAKLDSLAAKQQQPAPVVKKASPVRRSVIQSTGNRQKPDPRWKLMQNQIDAQSKQIDAQGKQIESTRQEIAGARTELGDSIARTHEELVVLAKKGERNYVEFDLDKSKNFHTTGPVGISLRKANTKHQYADLELLVDDRQVSKKHLNLYEPLTFYPSDERRPVELVINSITKNHIRGYISAPKYKTAELTAGNASAPAPSGSSPAAQQAAPPPRQKLR